MHLRHSSFELTLHQMSGWAGATKPAHPWWAGLVTVNSTRQIKFPPYHFKAGGGARPPPPPKVTFSFQRFFAPIFFWDFDNFAQKSVQNGTFGHFGVKIFRTGASGRAKIQSPGPHYCIGGGGPTRQPPAFISKPGLFHRPGGGG